VRHDAGVREKTAPNTTHHALGLNSSTAGASALVHGLDEVDELLVVALDET
jgi:hypothetical protein